MDNAATVVLPGVVEEKSERGVASNDRMPDLSQPFHVFTSMPRRRPNGARSLSSKGEPSMPNGNWPTILSISGTLHYDFTGAYLDEPGVRSLLVFHQPPSGIIVPQEIAAAAYYFHTYLRLTENAPVHVQGYRTTVNNHPAIAVVHA
jgi:hypothetical protein